MHSLINDVATIINYTYACRTHSPEKWMKGGSQEGKGEKSAAGTAEPLGGVCSLYHSYFI